MSKKILIFDFDFTLVDSLDSVMIFYNQIAQILNLKKVTKKDIKKLTNMTLNEVLVEFEVKSWQIPILAGYIKFKLWQKEDSLVIIDGVKEILLNLKKENYKIGILSSNSRINILRFLKKEEINFFDFVETERNIFGKDKALKKVLNSRKINFLDVIYIGDEVRDIVAMKKLGIKVMSVSWGLSSKEILQKHNPNNVINKPEEFFAKLKQLEL
jgi:phosphoglycolate phosphatase